MKLKDLCSFDTCKGITVCQFNKDNIRYYKSSGFPKNIRNAEVERNHFGELKILYNDKWRDCFFTHFEEDNFTLFTIYM